MTMTNLEAREQFARTVRDQIGMMNVLAISGGRIRIEGPCTVSLPVSNGYYVVIELDEAKDLYSVRREFRRAGKRWVKGKFDDVYCDELGDLAYYASCFRNVEFGDHIEVEED